MTIVTQCPKSFRGLNIPEAGKSVTSYRCVIAGPVCVATEHRGAGLFGLMYDGLHQILPSEVELITTLVSKSNPRSIRAKKGRYGYRWRPKPAI